MGMAGYAVLTPYIVPPGLKKRPNAGDGFVLGACEALLGQPAAQRFSAWAPLREAQLERVNQAAFLLVAGTNLLRDRLDLYPALQRATLQRLRVPVVLMGVGLYGRARATRGLTSAATALLEELLERFPLISVRCQSSAAYLRRALPRSSEAIRQTGCPSIYSVDGIERGFAREPSPQRFAVTVTDRSRIRPQIRMLRALAETYQASQWILSLHQDGGSNYLRRAAEACGYEVFSASDYRDYIEAYARCDIHVGNRLHAHLKFLSMGIPSFLMPFDQRQIQVSKSFDFPLIERVPSPKIESYDFGRFAARRRAAAAEMAPFVEQVRKLGQLEPAVRVR